MFSKLAAVTLITSLGFVHSFDPDFNLRVLDPVTNEDVGSINSCHVYAGINVPCFGTGVSAASYSLDQVEGSNTLGNNYVKPGNLTYSLGAQQIKLPLGLFSIPNGGNIIVGRFPSPTAEDLASVTFDTRDQQLALLVDGVPTSRWALCPYDNGTGTNSTVLSFITGAGALDNPDCKEAKIVRILESST